MAPGTWIRAPRTGITSAEHVSEVGGFSNVSKQAMMIRLLDLGLVVNCTGTFLGWRYNT